MFNGRTQFCLSLYLFFQNVCKVQYMWYIVRSDLNKAMNYCFKFFKMGLLSAFQNGIKTEDYWILENLFNNLFNDILDVQCPLFHWKLQSFDPLHITVHSRDILMMKILKYVDKVPFLEHMVNLSAVCPKIIQHVS